MLVAPSAASACIVAFSPDRLRTMEGDAILLVQVTHMESVDEDWTANAAILGNLVGSHPQGQITFGPGVRLPCYAMADPTPGRYYVLYLNKSGNNFQFFTGFSYWFARRSGDIRFAALDKLLPLGAARQPTPEESRLIDLAEPRLAAQTKLTDLSSFTRIYARYSPGGVTAMIFRSKTPQRLIVYNSEELPTEESCGCDPIRVDVRLDDLWDAGELPPFNP